MEHQNILKMHEISLQVNVSYQSGSLNDQDNSNDTTLIMFILWGIVLPLIAGIGLVGNILTMVVLWRKEMQSTSTTILYLRALVVTDTGILLGAVIFLTPISCAHYLHGEALDYFKDRVYPILHTPGYYLVMTLQQCNVWITVSVSIERYIAICHPFRAARLITRRKTFIVIITIAVVSMVYNTPHLFATFAAECPTQNGSVNTNHTSVNNNNNISTHPTLTTALSQYVSSSPSNFVSTTTPKSKCLMVTDTAFGVSTFYKTFRTVLYAAIIHVIPFCSLVILNSFLIRELMVMQKRRSGTNINEENEANLSLVLVLIVIVFIFCQTPGLISQFDIIPGNNVFLLWLAVSNLMFTTNSAVNFLIYTAFGRKFRKVLLCVFRHFYQGGRKSSNSSYRAWQYTNNDYEMSTVGDLKSLNSKRSSEVTRICNNSNMDKNSNGKHSERKPLYETNHSSYKQSVSDKSFNGKTHANGVV